MALLGQFIGILLITWLVLPIAIWLIQGLTILVIVFNRIFEVCGCFVDIHKTQQLTFNGYIPRNRDYKK